MGRLRNLAPVEARSSKGCCSTRIGNPLAFGWITEPSETSELISPSRGNRRSQFLLEIAEKEERCVRPKLFAHKQHWWRRGKQKNCQRHTHGTWFGKLGDPLAERAVSDLIMILKKGDKRSERHALSRLTPGCAVPVQGSLALISEPLGQTAAQVVERTFGVVRVVSILLARDQYVHRMMNIVIPLRRICSRLAALLYPLQVSWLVAIVLEDEVNMSIRRNRTPNRIGQLRKNIWGGVVGNFMNRVQTQSIEMIFGQPVECIVDKKISDCPAFRSVEIDAVAPGSTMTIGKELRRVQPQIISFRAKVVVNDIQQNHNSA